MRRGPLSDLGIIPQRAYYGSQTTPAMYVLTLSELWHWTGDDDLLRRHLGPALRTFEWADRYGRPRWGRVPRVPAARAGRPRRTRAGRTRTTRSATPTAATSRPRSRPSRNRRSTTSRSCGWPRSSSPSTTTGADAISGASRGPPAPLGRGLLDARRGLLRDGARAGQAAGPLDRLERGARARRRRSSRRNAPGPSRIGCSPRTCSPAGAFAPCRATTLRTTRSRTTSGSVWPVENATFALGLKRYGFDEEAERLVTRARGRRQPLRGRPAARGDERPRHRRTHGPEPLPAGERAPGVERERDDPAAPGPARALPVRAAGTARARPAAAPRVAAERDAAERPRRRRNRDAQVRARRRRDRAPRGD